MGTELRDERRALLAEALFSSEPGAALKTLARFWKGQGMPQPEMLALFNEQLKNPTVQDDERLYEAVTDTMDLLVGWCTPQNAIFPSDPGSGNGA